MNPGSGNQGTNEIQYYTCTQYWEEFKTFFNKKASSYGIRMIRNPEPWPYSRYRSPYCAYLMFERKRGEQTDKIYMVECCGEITWWDIPSKCYPEKLNNVERRGAVPYGNEEPPDNPYSMKEPKKEDTKSNDENTVGKKRRREIVTESPIRRRKKIK